MNYTADVLTGPNEWSWGGFAFAVGFGAITAGGGRYLAGKYSQWRASRRIFREDDFVHSPRSVRSGHSKSHIDSEGNLRPANPNGKTTVRQHIRGGHDVKGDSPYTSMKGQKGVGKKYGDKNVSIDKVKLQKDIKNGKVKDVEIISHKRIMAEHKAAIKKAQQRYNKHPTKKNLKRLKNAKRDYVHSIRDKEILIKGVVPKKYVRIDSPGPSTAHKMAVGSAVGTSASPKNYD